MKLRRTFIAIFFALAAAGFFYFAISVPAESTKTWQFRGMPHPGGALAIGFILTLCAAGFWFRSRSDF